MRIVLYTIFVVIVLGAAVLFSAQNSTPATVWFYNWQFTTPLAIVVFLAMISGALVTALGFLSAHFTRSIRRRSAQRAQKQEQTAPPASNIGQSASE